MVALLPFVLQLRHDELLCNKERAPSAEVPIKADACWLSIISYSPEVEESTSGSQTGTSSELTFNIVDQVRITLRI